MSHDSSNKIRKFLCCALHGRCWCVLSGRGGAGGAIQKPDEGFCQVASQAADAAQHVVSIEGVEVGDNKYDCLLKTDLHEGAEQDGVF